MRSLKPILATVALVLFVRYGAVYYSTSEFNRFIHEEVTRTTSKDLLRTHILHNAQEHSLSLNDEDISITSQGSQLQVEIHYLVPLNYYVGKHVMAFQASASGEPPKHPW